MEVDLKMFNSSTKEALVLLQLPQGTSLLLKETLYKCLHQFDADREKSAAGNDKQQALKTNKENQSLTAHNAKNALKEFGILKLSCEQAELVLSLRINF
jgi:hypothetical protein